MTISLRMAGGLIGLAALFTTGCVSFDKAWLGMREGDVTPISQAHTRWENHIVVIEDAVNNGRPVAGMAGRLYFFGPEVLQPLKGKGAVTVDLFDATGAAPGPQSQPLVHVDFDAKSLDRLYHKDGFGWGYTLFIPWETYRPDVLRVLLRVRYAPDKGTPIYAPPSTITLRNEGTVAIQNGKALGLDQARNPRSISASR